MNTARTIDQSARQLAEIDNALRNHRLGVAETLCSQLTSNAPDFVEGWVAFARLRQMQGDYAAMRKMAARVIKSSRGHPRAHLLEVEALIHLGEVKQAKAKLAKLKKAAKGDASLLVQVSEAYSQIGAFSDSVRLAEAANTLNPGDQAVLYGLTTGLVALGDMARAEEVFDELLNVAPHDFDAYYNRATLRKQTPEQNHVDEIQSMLADPKGAKLGRVQLNYALAKELEDLGQYKESFAALKQGAEARRAAMAYRVEGDVATMEALRRAFSKDYFTDAGAGFDREGPVFVLGLPRSGTTLVDRILSAHSRVESFGEIIEFAMSLTTLAKAEGGKAEGGKAGLIEASTQLDPKVLGEMYDSRARQRGSGADFYIDKTPVNFLYIGLIATALPNARIVHVIRDPMDNAFAMYKTLFRMGYPFSYDFADLAAYMSAKDALMAHWREMLPGRIIDIRYEDLIGDQEGESRRLIEAVGLTWEEACLRFHENKSPSATASAAQVRQPLYKSAVGRWRQYEHELAPLAELLEVK